MTREGILVTGGSGSGKSTLIDAITAVLLPQGKLRFNSAHRLILRGIRDAVWLPISVALGVRRRIRCRIRLSPRTYVPAQPIRWLD
ncbi:hypothetical protein LZ605_22340 (plasmid) [Stenotrophomonas maltophilia]|nr:hypothetical protein LZ605_22340 [Stenotrophomonas maltophilia]